MPVIWSQENDQRLIKAMWESPSKSFGDIGTVFFGHAVKTGSAECQQIMRRIHKLTGKSDSSGTVKASRSPSGVQKKRAGRRRKKSSTPSEADTDGGFDERVAFPGETYLLTKGVCDGSDSFVGANILCRSAGLFKLRRAAAEVAKSPSMQAKISG
ncbi:hypothetical protein SMMN14_09373 [Sphaerulina musiva]